jgi:uncharacterized membrane protein YfcA
MRTLIVFALVGFGAQLVDGALGMAYGVTSTSLLLLAGTNPATASASVHLAEVGTTLAAGASHWRFGNVDWRTVGLMALPGSLAAFVGAVILSSLSAEVAEPWMAAILFSLGVDILWRFSRPRQRREPRPDRKSLRAVFLSPLGAFAGLIDAMGGGGWGPIGTSSLLASERLEPRKVVGSIDTSEFLVTLGASAGFLVALSFAQINVGWLVALLVGGLIAAPIAAWLVRKLPARVLGAAVGGLILVTNTKTFGEAVGAPAEVLVAAYAVFVPVWVAAVASAVAAVRRGLHATPQPA